MLLLFFQSSIAPPIAAPGVFDHHALIAHIEAHNAEVGGVWREVALSADLAYLEANDRIVTPGVWVVPGDERTRDAGSSCHIIRQSTRISVQVVTATQNYRISDFSAGNMLALGEARLALKHHIIGFRSPGFEHSLRHVRGRLMRYTDELLLYVDEFAADTFYQKVLH